MKKKFQKSPPVLFFHYRKKSPMEGLLCFAICTTKGGSWLRLGIYLFYWFGLLLQYRLRY